MNVKDSLGFWFLAVCVAVMFGQEECEAAREKAIRLRTEQAEVAEQARERITLDRERSLELQEGVLTEARDKVKLGASEGCRPCDEVKERIDGLLRKKRIEPDEIATAKKDLDSAVVSGGLLGDRREYEHLGEKLELVHKFTKAQAGLEESYKSTLEKSTQRVDELADDNMA